MKHNTVLKNHMVMKTKIYIITSLLFIAIFTACEKSEIPDRTFVANGAEICFLNLSSDGVLSGTSLANTNEINLYFNGARVSTQYSIVTGKLRGIPFRSSYPGAVVVSPSATTYPTSYIGAEYFNATPGQTNILAKDTLAFAGQTTLFNTDFNFEQGKYYSIFAMDLISTMAPVIVEDAIVPFTTINKVKVRAVDALMGVVGGKIDIWLIHQPSTTEIGKAPYKFVSGLDYKAVTAFTDTISSGSYKWTVTIAGAVPTAITPPVPDPNPAIGLLGKPYTITFSAPNTLVAQTTNTFSQRTTYSLLIYGQFGKTLMLAPVGNLFRNRLM
jgi:hypothetical protein